MELTPRTMSGTLMKMTFIIIALSEAKNAPTNL